VISHRPSLAALVLTLGLSGILPDKARAHRELFTPEEKERLTIAAFSNPCAH
jgi:hypothetical protein